MNNFDLHHIGPEKIMSRQQYWRNRIDALVKRKDYLKESYYKNQLEKYQTQLVIYETFCCS